MQTAILEKRLMCDLAARERKIMMQNMSDLKAYYDNKLTKTGFMAQEAVGVER